MRSVLFTVPPRTFRPRGMSWADWSPTLGPKCPQCQPPRPPIAFHPKGFRPLERAFRGPPTGREGGRWDLYPAETISVADDLTKTAGRCRGGSARRGHRHEDRPRFFKIGDLIGMSQGQGDVVPALQQPPLGVRVDLEIDHQRARRDQL